MNNLEGTKRMEVTDRIEGLRLILERQQVKAVSREEALEIGDSLIAFYETLADDFDSVTDDAKELEGQYGRSN